MNYTDIKNILANEADTLLNHTSKTFNKDSFYFPKSTLIDDVYSDTDRSNQVLRNLASLYKSGNLKDTGYLSILPVDQGIEHSAGASFAANPMYFDPENIVKLALEAGCSGVTSTLGVMGLVSRK